MIDCAYVCVYDMCLWERREERIQIEDVRNHCRCQYSYITFPDDKKSTFSLIYLSNIN